MINYTSKKNIAKLIELEKFSLMSMLDIQKNLSDKILIFMKNYIENIETNLDSDSDNKEDYYINESTSALTKLSSNIDSVQTLINELDELMASHESLSATIIKENVKTYNNQYTECIDSVSKHTDYIEEFIHKISLADLSEFLEEQPKTTQSTQEAVKTDEAIDTKTTSVDKSDNLIDDKITFVDKTDTSTDTSIANETTFVDMDVFDKIDVLKDAKTNLVDTTDSLIDDKTDTLTDDKTNLFHKVDVSKDAKTNLVDTTDSLIDDKTDTLTNNKTNDLIENTSLTSDETNNSYLENTLVISDLQEKIILPYKLCDIKKIILDKDNNYSSIQEVIDNVYTIPFKYYNFSPIARFREAYKLVVEKEHGSKFKALALAIELFANYNLHPAIITACNSLDELDIYLACLDDDKLNDFKFFDIKYEIAPAIRKDISSIKV